MNKKVFDEELGVVIDPEVRQILEIKEALDYGKKLEEYVMSPEFKGSIIKNEERFKLRQEIYDFLSGLIDPEFGERVEMGKIDMASGVGYVTAYFVDFSVNEQDGIKKLADLLTKVSCFGAETSTEKTPDGYNMTRVDFTIPDLYTIIYDEFPDL